MDFEKSLAFSSSNLCCWSPNGRFLAVVSAKSRLELRDSATLDVIRAEIIVTGNKGGISEDCGVDSLLFSPDSQFIVASDFKRGTSFVYKVGADKVCT